MIGAGSRPPRPSRLLRALAVALLLLGAARIVAVVAHQPLAGYANQFDMLRSSACLGLWPDLATPAQQRAAHPRAPIARYVRGERSAADCYPSSAVAVAAVALALDRAARLVHDPDPSGISLRRIGALYAALALAIAAWGAWRLRGRGGALLAHAAFFAGVVADPFDTLWYATLYTEAPALLGAWSALLGLAVLALEPRPTRGPWLALLAGSALLGASRVQHLLLPLVLMVVAWLLLRARRLRARRALLAGVVVALGCLALAVHTQSRHPTLGHANRIDTVFGAVLPAAADPAALGQRLGLAPACDELVHTTWYLRRGRDALAECPQIAEVGPGRLARVLASEPRTLAVAFARGIGLSTAWRMPYLGEVAEASRQRVAPGPLGLRASLADATAARGFRFHFVFWTVPVLLGLAAGARLLLPPRRPLETALAADALLAASGAFVALGWASSVLGDGYSELARHLHLAVNAALASWLLALARLLCERRALPWRALGLLGACGLALGLAQLALRLPLAYGVVNLPADEQVRDDLLALEGWVLSPVPLARVELRFGDAAPIELPLAPDPLVAEVYPLAGGAAVAAYRVLEPPPWPAGHARLPMTLTAIDAHGNASILDRRWLVDARPLPDASVPLATPPRSASAGAPEHHPPGPAPDKPAATRAARPAPIPSATGPS